MPGRPSLVDHSPSCMTPPPVRVRSSACWMTGTPKCWAYIRARRISSAFITGLPSSEIARTPARTISPISASSSPSSPLLIGADGIDPGVAVPPRLQQDVLGHRAAVVDRLGVRHAGHGGEAAGRRGHGAGAHRLLVLLPRLAQVDVDVDQPGRHHQPGGVEGLGVLRRLDAAVELGDPAVLDQQVERAVEVLARVDHPAAVDQQLRAMPRRSPRGRRTAGRGSPCAPRRRG